MTDDEWLAQVEEAVQAAEASTDFYLAGKVDVLYVRPLLDEVKLLRRRLATLASSAGRAARIADGQTEEEGR